MAITLFPNGKILHNGVEVASPKMVQQSHIKVSHNSLVYVLQLLLVEVVQT